APSVRKAFFQVCNRFWDTPSRRATSATASICSVIIWTAWSLNSGVYVLRVRAIGGTPLNESLHHIPAVHYSWGRPEFGLLPHLVSMRLSNEQITSICFLGRGDDRRLLLNSKRPIKIAHDGNDRISLLA